MFLSFLCLSVTMFIALDLSNARMEAHTQLLQNHVIKIINIII